MNILVFLHGTIIMHESGMGQTREVRVQQVIESDPSVLRYDTYVPIGKAVHKLRKWHEQGAHIFYCSSHIAAKDIEQDRIVFKTYDFPKGEVLYRHKGEDYEKIAQQLIPDILIEDDCESIGGEREMIFSHLKPEARENIKCIVIPEFGGIDHLPDDVSSLMKFKEIFS